MRIEQWVNQEHLEPARGAVYAKAFTSALYHSITIDNFLCPEKFANLRQFFATEGNFEEKFYLGAWVHGHDSEEAVPAEVWRAAPEDHRASVECIYIGPRPDFRMGLGTITNIKFAELLQSPMFMNFLEAVTGIRCMTLTGFMTRMLVGGQYITPHNDFREDRSLCGVFYVSEDWHPSYGGCFRHRGTGSDSVRVEPLPNRLLLFQPRADLQHDVEPIGQAGANWRRCAYTLWFGIPLPTEGQQVMPPQAT
jgi:hypothetical protein